MPPSRTRSASPRTRAASSRYRSAADCTGFLCVALTVVAAGDGVSNGLY